jgi:predicted SAM-dependent methyltransferase
MKRYLSQFRHWFKQHRAHYKLLRGIKNKKEIRIILGSGGLVCEGFVSTDYPQLGNGNDDSFGKYLELDICNDDSFGKYLKPQSVDVFLAEHVWEHLSQEDGSKAARNCFKYLKRGGLLRIAVPDGFHCNSDYISQVKPGGYGAGANDHKILYNYQTFSALLENAGYKVRLLEWFDEHGKFHHENWSVENGLIRRSMRFDPRNKGNSTTYTSLIIDAIKS